MSAKIDRRVRSLDRRRGDPSICAACVRSYLHLSDYDIETMSLADLQRVIRQVRDFLADRSSSPVDGSWRPSK